MTSRFILALSFALAAAPAFAADYQVNLGPMPLDDETKAVIAGRGEATIHSDGKTMSVTGNFHGLPSNATEGHILISPVTGVPGKPVFDLNIPKATSGEISGEFKLTPAQAGALRTGRLYIQLNSEKAPADMPWGPKGTLWGWIFPAHPTPGQDVPEEGHWFLPQFDTPQS
ncbi:MAG TPA: CHRD domain-containing protein [Rhizomicrobium sp.]|nr:CHRD domain-containing protein [Rhizomicrobium sp.]